MDTIEEISDHTTNNEREFSSNGRDTKIKQVFAPKSIY
jgi:hypothetical protein